MFLPLFAFQFIHVLLCKTSSITWKQMLLEKETRYDKRTYCNPVCQYLYGIIYLQQWPRFVTPKPNPLLWSWYSVRSTGITIWMFPAAKVSVLDWVKPLCLNHARWKLLCSVISVCVRWSEKTTTWTNSRHCCSSLLQK